MTYSYSGDPSNSQKDEVRFVLQDTDPGLQLLTDEEIDFLIEKWLPRYDSLTYVAAIAAATIARKFVGVVDINADGVSVNAAELMNRYTELAKQLRAEYVAAQIGGEVDLSSIMIGQTPDPRIKPLAFGIGLHDNPEAGLQDFGSWVGDPFADAAYPWN